MVLFWLGAAFGEQRVAHFRRVAHRADRRIVRAAALPLVRVACIGSDAEAEVEGVYKPSRLWRRRSSGHSFWLVNGCFAISPFTWFTATRSYANAPKWGAPLLRHTRRPLLAGPTDTEAVVARVAGACGGALNLSPTSAPMHATRTSAAAAQSVRQNKAPNGAKNERLQHARVPVLAKGKNDDHTDGASEPICGGSHTKILNRRICSFFVSNE